MSRLFGLVCAGCLLAGAALAQSPVTLSVDTQSPGRAIPEDYSGVSFGTVSLRPGSSGYFFDFTNAQAVTLFRQLGIRNLRVGGTSVDTNGYGYTPAHADVDALFRFAQAAGLKVIYSLRLMNGDAAEDAAMADYIWSHDRQYLDRFAIGNEPDLYQNRDPDITNYTSYLAKWRSFADTIVGSVPDATFGGPDGGGAVKGIIWGTNFAADEAASGIVGAIHYHYYVGHNPVGKTIQEMIDEMLSQSWVTVSNPAEYASAAVPVLSLGFPYRFTEANCFSSGGGLGVAGGNNCFATALFALDFLHWWAAHDCAGVHFHTTMWKYNGTLYPDANGNYQVYPIGYGIKAFDVGGHGSVVPVAITNPDALNLTGYAVGDGTNLFVTLINKEHGIGARSAAAAVVPLGRASGSAAAMFLAAPDNNPAATNGVTLGGAPIRNNGPWAGQWTPLGPLTNGRCSVVVPPASAAIVRIQPPAPPQIVRDLPAGVTLVAGQSVSLSVEAKGSIPLSYQWHLEANPVEAATNSTYALTAGAAGTTAACCVVITNRYGAVTSTVSTVTVVPPPMDFCAVQMLNRWPAGYWPLRETCQPAPVTMETNFGTLGAMGNAYYAMTNPVDVLFGRVGALSGSGDDDPSVQFVGVNGTSDNTITNFNSYAFVPRLTPALTLQPPLTLECWIKDNVNNGSFGDLIGEGGNGLNSANNSGDSGGIRLSYSGKAAGGPDLQVYIYTGSGTTRISGATPPNSLPRGIWHHCVATCDGTNVLMYIDGVQQGSFTATMAPDAWSPLTIGQGLWYGNHPRRAFSGLEDEVAIYTNVLSPAAVANHYLAGITTGANYRQTVLADRPLLYYRMDAAAYTNPPVELSPIAVNYGSAAVRGLYLSGLVPGEVPGPAIPSLGTNSMAAAVNGIFGCVDAGNDPVFNPTGTQPFTAMTWFRTYPSDNGVGALMSHGSDSSWSIQLDGADGHLVFSTGAGGSVASMSILNDGNWHHVAGVFDGSHNDLYVDGRLDNSNSATGAIVGNAGNPLYLGGDPDYTQVGGDARYFAGALAQAAFFTNALTGEEVRALYQAGTDIPTPDTLTLEPSGAGRFRLNWNYGMLESATNVGGPYSDVIGAYPPFMVTPAGARQFFRLREN